MVSKANLDLVVVAALGLLALCGPVWASEPTEGLIAHWKFDEGEGTIAYDSAGDNHGTIYGDQWTTGQIDGALSFDGVYDYVEVSDDSSFGFSQSDSFTIAFWAMPLSGGGRGHVVGKMRASNCRGGIFGYETLWVSSESRFDFSVEKSCFGWVEISTPDDSAAAGSWCHVTAVYDNKDMRIYLNGESSGGGTFTYNTGSTIPDKNLAIGARSYDSTIEKYFNGSIDDVRIYDRALSDEEIRELYYAGFSGTELAILLLEDAIAEKVEMLEVIDETLQKELAAYNTLEELLASGNYGDLNKHDILTAQQKVRSAIQRQERSKRSLEESIGRVEDALMALAWAPPAEMVQE